MNDRDIDLRAVRHPDCLKCTRQERATWSDGQACQHLRSVKDGLAVRCVGDWAYEKIFHLHKYFDIFASAMAGKWAGLNYVEICSGPGRCVFKETGEEVDGSALAMLNHPRFHLLHTAMFIDNDAETVDVLTRRIAQLGRRDRAVAYVGDYTDTDGILRLLKKLPERHLNLVFIDPTDCSVPFITVGAIIKGLEKVDLIINLPVYMDAGRNLAKATINPGYVNARKKYADFLGVDDFFNRDAVRKLALTGDDRALRCLFRDAYLERLCLFGHEHTALRPIRSLYELLFASRHSLGLKFWKAACAFDTHGQSELSLEV